MSTPQQTLAHQLQKRYSPGEAAAIARIVFEDVFGRRQELTVAEQHRLHALTDRLVAGEPVQYVLGEADFFGLKFRVTPSVLIPRQETEELVAWVLDDLRASGNPTPVVLDAGLGSGCIGLTIKKKFPGVRLYGIEKSSRALAVARDNAVRLLGSAPAGWDSQPDLRHGDLLDPAAWDDLPPLDVLVSNPPYIPHGEAGLMPPHVLDHEPHLALFVPDHDPLLFYRALADRARSVLRPGGRIFFECNEFNAADVVQLLRERHFHSVELKKDLGGADRMVRAIRQDSAVDYF